MIYIKFALFFLWTFTLGLILLIAHFFLWPFPYIERKLQNTLTPIWGNFFCWLGNVEVILKGKFPEKPSLIISNHLGYLDILSFFTVLKCHFLAKLDISTWPLFGKMITLAGTLYIDRSKKMDLIRVIPTIIKTIKDGGNVFFFPEGTSRAGRELGNFFPALFEASIRSQIPVVIASISYYVDRSENKSVNDFVCWHGNNLSFVEHLLKLFSYKKIIAYIQVAEEQVLNTDAKALSMMAREHMLKIFRPSENVESLASFRKKLLEEVKTGV